MAAPLLEVGEAGEGLVESAVVALHPHLVGHDLAQFAVQGEGVLGAVRSHEPLVDLLLAPALRREDGFQVAAGRPGPGP